MWLCDIHLLAGALDAGQWRELQALARRARVAHICGVELRRAVERLGTPVDAAVVAALCAVAGEPTAQYLRPLGPMRDFWFELRAAPTARARWTLVKRHVLPPPDYIAGRYDYDGRAWLPILYAHRALTGAARWTRDLVRRLAS
jgi:hypothetical protein